MQQTTMHLYIANKLYSSWSLRPWLLMTALGIPFEERVIPMYFPDSKARMLDVSPTGKMPCLVVPPAEAAADPSAAQASCSAQWLKVWESLAIIEYLHERYPDKGVWPKASAARAHARAVSNEMHAGFMALRQMCPMNLGKRFAPRELASDAADNVRRLEGMWSDCRRRFKGSGEFLFGDFCAADAMFAPVVTRFLTYGVKLPKACAAYCKSIMAMPEMKEWVAAARAEPEEIEELDMEF
jgi:glutathione S-transferase